MDLEKVEVRRHRIACREASAWARRAASDVSCCEGNRVSHLDSRTMTANWSEGLAKREEGTHGPRVMVSVHLSRSVDMIASSQQVALNFLHSLQVCWPSWLSHKAVLALSTVRYSDYIRQC